MTWNASLIRAGVATAIVAAPGLVGCSDLTSDSPAPRLLPIAPSPGPGADQATAARDPASDLTCPGDSWPPLSGPSATGIATRSIDRAHVEIRNAAARGYFFRLSGWEVLQLETCRGLIELELERGPLGPHSAVTADLGYLVDRLDVPITVAIWSQPCGESCRRDPDFTLLVARSLLRPPAS